MARLFGTDGVRGIANSDLSVSLATKLGMAAAYVLTEHNNADEKPNVLIGKDTRISGDMLESALSAGLCAMGANVISVGVVPTPAVAYLTQKYNCSAGVMISASHNPYEYNGIKIFKSDGYKLDDSIEDEIEEIIKSDSYVSVLKEAEKIGTCSVNDNAVSDYIEHIVSCAPVRLDGMKIALDCANGSASVCAEQIFTQLGAEVCVNFSEPNGVNINDGCGSTHLERLSEIVKCGNFDAGIAFDGDADRMLAVDENGEVIDGDRIIAICAEHMKNSGKLKKNTAVVTVMSNMGFYKFCSEKKINCEKTAVGDRYVLEKMLKCGYNIGGEQSGHIIFLDYATTGDGELSAVMLLSALKESNKKLSEAAEVMSVYPQVLINVRVTPEGKQKYINNEYIISAVQKAELELMGDGRVLVRVSGTEPLVRVMLEGKDINKITELGNMIADVVRERLN